jgi:hypothetical protein
VIEGAWRWHRSWRVGRSKLGLASKAVRKGAVCELTGTIERKEVVRRRFWGGDRVLYSPLSGEGTPCPIGRSVPACSLGGLRTGRLISIRVEASCMNRVCSQLNMITKIHHHDKSPLTGPQSLQNPAEPQFLRFTLSLSETEMPSRVT